MTTPDLASAVRAYLSDPVLANLGALHAALARHDAPAGEVVRVAAWRDERPSDWTFVRDYDPKDPAWDECPPPDFYVTFHAPPKRETPVVEGQVQ